MGLKISFSSPFPIVHSSTRFTKMRTFRLLLRSISFYFCLASLSFYFDSLRGIVSGICNNRYVCSCTLIAKLYYHQRLAAAALWHNYRMKRICYLIASSRLVKSTMEGRTSSSYLCILPRTQLRCTINPSAELAVINYQLEQLSGRQLSTISRTKAQTPTQPSLRTINHLSPAHNYYLLEHPTNHLSPPAARPLA
ncbi:hypothetical protein HDK64DRAFT_112349 [Phyllosticta capitalensis]